MAVFGALAAILAAPVSTSAQTRPPLVVETDPLAPAEQREKFHLPPGFEIQLVASEPDIGQPMNMNFDARGRLWVTSSVEYPYPVAGEGVESREERWGEPEEREPRDWVTVFSGIDDSGKPAKVTRFAENLNIPIGIIPDGDGAIIYSIPNIERFRDTDGDGRADERERLYGPFGNVDTHGMVNSFTRGLDGWIYACHGFRNTSKVQGTDGHAIEMNSGNTFRFQPDGSRIEHWTFGQVNPFGLCFDPWGNLYSADCHSKPLTCLLRGAYYESFGKPHDGLGFGPDMIDHNHGSTGICGCAWYEADHFPPEYNGCIFLCNPVTGRVHRDQIKFRGSSPWANTQPDFVTCDDGWFRPVDVKLGPDGALYIADFYNAIIGHYEVPLEHPKRDRMHGRIWRVVYRGEGSPESRVQSPEQEQASSKSKTSQSPPLGKGGSVPAMFDLTKLTLDELLERLDSHNLTTRTLAFATILATHSTEDVSKAAEARWYARDLPPLSDAGRADVIRLVGKRLAYNPIGHVVWTDDSPMVIAAAIRNLAEFNPDGPLLTDDFGGDAQPELQKVSRDPRVLRVLYEQLAAHSVPLTHEMLVHGGQAFLERAIARLGSNAQDTHLHYQILVALRALLEFPENEPVIRTSAVQFPDVWTSVALGSRSPTGSRVLLGLLPKLPETKHAVAVQQIARFGGNGQLDELIGQFSSQDSQPANTAHESPQHPAGSPAAGRRSSAAYRLGHPTCH